MGKNCAVIGCSNSTVRIYKWRTEPCTIHEGKTRKECGCWMEPPYRLYCFPSEIQNNDARKRWIHCLRRENKNKSAWKPGVSDRVCSIHFVDGAPTVSNPYPTLNMGYDVNEKKSRRKLFRALPTPAVSSDIVDEPMDVETLNSPASLSDHSYLATPQSKPCQKCKDKDNLINSLVGKVNKLSAELKRASREKMFKTKSSFFNWRNIKTDAKMNFYTGIQSIAMFNTLFLLLSPYLPKLKYWRGAKRSFSKIKRRFVNASSATKILSHRDEFLLTLMRLRLGLLNEDLADRFGISPAICSNTFTTWIKLLSKILGGALVAWLPRESIRDNLPKLFKSAGHSNCRVILDCTELFIERPKSLFNQAATWSDYKHHNTIKYLVGISPTGFISFLSDCYGGRSSDKFITSDSGFYDLLERGDEVMADRGFQIREELMLRFCSLSVPPGARVKSQMTTAECKKTKDVANLRIHVERAINRMKCFHILKRTLTVTMLHHADDIIRTCAALCNLKPLLIKSK